MYAQLNGWVYTWEPDTAAPGLWTAKMARPIQRSSEWALDHLTGGGGSFTDTSYLVAALASYRFTSAALLGAAFGYE